MERRTTPRTPSTTSKTVHRSACCSRAPSQPSDGLAALGPTPIWPLRRRRSDRCAASCTARTAGWQRRHLRRAVELVRAELVDACSPSRSTARWGGGPGAPPSPRRGPAGWSSRSRWWAATVRSGHVQLAPPSGTRCRSSSYPEQVRPGPPRPGLHQRGQGRLLASLWRRWLAWLTTRRGGAIPRRLRDLVELAEAELPDGTPSAPTGPAPSGDRFCRRLTDNQAVGLMDPSPPLPPTLDRASSSDGGVRRSELLWQQRL